MTRDALSEAVEALRGSPTDDDGDETRERITATLHRRGQLRRTAVSTLIVLLVFGCGTTVFAWSTGWLPEIFEQEPARDTSNAAPAADEVVPPRSVRTVSSSALPEELETVEPETAQLEREAPVAVERPRARPAQGRRRAHPPGLAPPDPEQDEAALRRAELDTLYRNAHEAHFRARDPAAALAAWDAYLALAAADERFVREARYNRALSLVRLRRFDEARSALRPYAEGRFGSYRQQEAQQLLESLSEY